MHRALRSTTLFTPVLVGALLALPPGCAPTRHLAAPAAVLSPAAWSAAGPVRPIVPQDSPGPALTGPHTFGLSMGVAHSDSENGGSIGVEYEYNRRSNLGIGGMLDLTGGNFREALLAVPLYFHRGERLVLIGAPGINFSSRDEQLALRLGGGYEVPLGDLTLRPSLYYDVLDSADNIWVFAVAFRRSF